MTTIQSLVQEFEIPAESYTPQDYRARYRAPEGPLRVPSIFVKFWLLITLALFLVPATLLWYVFLISPIRKLPDYRWSTHYSEARPTVAVPGPDSDRGHLWIGSQREGILRVDTRTKMWREPITHQSTGGALPSDHVESLQHAAPDQNQWTSFVCEEEGLKGLTFGDWSHGVDSPRFWPTPFLDFSHLGIDTGDTLTSKAAGFRGDELILGSAHSGIGVYHLPTRRWVAHITAESGGISSNHVFDLYRWRDRVLVAHDQGIDICCEREGNWAKVATITGLGSKGVARMHPRIETPRELELWCVTIGQGLAAIRLRPDGSLVDRRVLISERSVPGLTAELCRLADYHPRADVLWVGFEQEGGLAFARYMFTIHDWVGTREPLRSGQIRSLLAEEKGSAFVGTSQGLWQVWDAGEANLRASFRGLRDEDVREVAASTSTVWVRSSFFPPADAVPRRIRHTQNAPPQQDGAWSWADLIGPRRFPELSDADLTAAARIPGTADYFFGTRSKGIGRWYTASHEPKRAFRPGQNDCPSGVFDLACPSAQELVAITTSREVVEYDGRAWRRLFTPTAMAGQIADVITAAASGSSLILAAGSNVGMYDMLTQRWRELPPLADIVQLHRTRREVWARTAANHLYVLRDPDSAGTAWQQVAEHVTNIRGTEDVLLALVEVPDQPRHLFVAEKGQTSLRPLLTPQPLADVPETFDACYAAGEDLYVAFPGRRLARYNLSTHAWEDLGWPPTDFDAKQLEATEAGLWLLCANGDLWLWIKERRFWIDPAVCSQVESITADGPGLLVLRRPDRQSQSRERLLRIVDHTDQLVLIGAPLWEEIRGITAAHEFASSLFLGGRGGVHRFRIFDHDWKSFPLDSGQTCAVFAPTRSSLYLLAVDEGRNVGHLLRYSLAEDEIIAVEDPNNPGHPVQAEKLTSDGREMIAFFTGGRGIQSLSDTSPDSLRILLASSDSGLRDHQVTVATERDETLIVGTDRGTIHIYGRRESRPAQWQVVTVQGQGGVPGQPNLQARRIFLPAPDTMVVVLDRDVQIFTQKQGEWQFVRRLFPGAERCDAWDAGSSQLLLAATTRQADAQAGCYTEVFLQPLGDGTARKPLLGAPIDSGGAEVGTSVAVAEWETPQDVWIFRAAGDGQLWQYSLRGRSWARQTLERIEEFHLSGRALWAYSPEEMTLYRLTRTDKPEWEVIGTRKQVADFVGDDTGVLVRSTNGRLELYSSTGGTGLQPSVLIEGLPADFPKQALQLIAAAESGDVLLCAFPGAGAFAYDLSRHQWQQKFTGAIRRFLRTGGSSPQLFVLAQDGTLHVWSDANRSFTLVKTPVVAQDAVVVDDQLVIVSREGGLYASTAGMRWETIVDPAGRLSARAWPAVGAVTELQEMLLLALEEGDRTRVVGFEPQTIRWRAWEPVTGRPERFLATGGRLWLVTTATGGTKRVYEVSAQSQKPVPIGGALRAVNISNDGLWALSDQGLIVHAPAGAQTLTPVNPNLELALPLASRGGVTSAGAIGSELVVALADGSVWHRTEGTLGWRKLIESARAQGFRRQIITLGGMLITSEPDGTILTFDPAKNAYRALASGEAVDPASRAQSIWEVEGAPAGGAVRVRRVGSARWSDLSSGRLPEDDFVDIAADARSIFVQTAAGSLRAFERGTLREVSPTDQPAAPGGTFARPSPFALEGKNFTVAEDSQGPWHTNRQQVRLSIELRSSGAWALSGPLRPHAQGDQCGIDWQWATGLASDGNHLLVSTPGGPIVYEKSGGKFAPVAFYHAPTPSGGAPKLEAGPPPRVSWPGGQQMVWDSTARRLRPAEARDEGVTKLSGPLADILAKSALGSRWAIAEVGNAVGFLLTTEGGQTCLVRLDTRGFGFDNVAGMALTSTEIVLYTRDGTVRYPRGGTLGPPRAIETAQAVPAEAIAAECRTAKRRKEAELAIIGRKPRQGWVLQADRWLPVSETALRPDTKTPLWEGKFCRWLDDQQIQLNFATGTRAGDTAQWVTTSFDRRCGRLGIDQWTAVAAFTGQFWAITRSGLVRVGADRMTEFFLTPDSPYNWQAKGTFDIINDEDGASWLVAQLERSDTGDQEILVWDRNNWRPLAPGERLFELFRQRSEFLHQGPNWRVRASQVNATPVRTFERRWPWQKTREYSPVSIDHYHPKYPGVFDFERVNDLVFHQGELCVATDAGVLRIEPATCRILMLRPTPSQAPAEQICVRDGNLYVSSQGVFRWDSSSRNWTAAGDIDPFLKSPVLLDSPRWRVVSDTETEIWCRLAQSDAKHTRVRIVPDPAQGYRFDFDVVSSVHGDGRAVFASTELGAIERRLAQLEDLLLVRLSGGKPLDRSARVFTIGPKEQQRLMIEHQGVFYERSAGGAWQAVDDKTRSWILSTRGRYETWSLTWFVELVRGTRTVRVRLLEDQRYKPTQFIAPKGLFDFDLLNDTTATTEPSGGYKIFLATQGGIVMVRPEGRWVRRFADSQEDGLGNVNVQGLAGRTLPNLTAEVVSPRPGAPVEYYGFQADAWRWVPLPPTPPPADVYKRRRFLLFDDPKGWSGADLAGYRGLKRPLPGQFCPVSLSWKNHPVWLIDTPAGIAFAHDQRFSVENYEKCLWFATLGGVVRWSRPARGSQSSAGSTDIDIIAADFVPTWDLYSPPPRPSLGLIKYVDDIKTLVTLPVIISDRNDAASRYDPARGFRWDPQQKVFVAATTEHCQRAQRVVDDNFWFWRKEGPDRLTVDFHPGRAQIPARYERVRDGTFRFFDPIASPGTNTQLRSIIGAYGQLFVATAGGIIVFDGRGNQPLKLFALAEASPGGAKLSLENPLGLFYHVLTEQVFAICPDNDNRSRPPRKFVFQPADPTRGQDDRWIEFRGRDPLQDADLFVNNALLQWRQKPSGAQIQLKNTDLSPATPYQLFHRGKFSFDYVLAIAPTADTVWLATAGGTVEVDAANRRIQRIFAECFGINPETRLPDVREVVYSGLSPSDNQRSVYARTGHRQAFRFQPGVRGQLGRWLPVQADIANQAFDTAYRKPTFAPEFWSWVQPPEGIYVELQRTEPPQLRFGLTAPQAHCPLMSRGRFAWDDLTDAVLVGQELFMATPAGICLYQVDLPTQRAQFQVLFGAVAAADGGTIPMTQIERLVTEGTELVAWNNSHVFRGRKTSSGWQWSHDPSCSPADMRRMRRWKTDQGDWTVIADADGRGLRVQFAPSSAPQQVHTVVYAPLLATAHYDLPRAALTPEGMLIPGARGVLFIDIAFAKRQHAWRPIALSVTGACAVLFVILFAPAFRKKEKKSTSPPVDTPAS